MKKILFNLIILSCVFSINANDLPNTYKDVQIVGSTASNGMHYNSINVNGKITASELVVDKLSSITGSANLIKSSLQDLTVKGAIDLKNSSVNGTLNSSGPVKLSQSKLLGRSAIIRGKLRSDSSRIDANIEIQGGLISANDIFTQPVTVMGLLMSTNSTFNQNVTINSRNVQFINSNLKQNLISTTKSMWVKPEIILNNTKICGDVIFEQHKGKVILKGSSAIYGKIINGDSK